MVDVWEDLRKRARTLENHIDVKLLALNKLASGTPGRYESSINDNSSVSGSSSSSRQNVFNSLSTELEAMIAKLTQLNDQMNEHIGRYQQQQSNGTSSSSSSGWASNPALQHTLRRHHEILRDYSSEFTRSHDNIQNQLQRESLLSGGSSNDVSCLNNRLKPSDLYLKEHEHISSCDRLLDEQISIAMSTKEHVYSQRMTLRDISKKVSSITKKYPMLNNIMQKIQMKKRKDTVIVAAVISTCLMLMFLYMMHSPAAAAAAP